MQLLESVLKKELVDNYYQSVRALTNYGEKAPCERRSISIAGGAPFFEVSMRVPNWAAQVSLFYTHPLMSMEHLSHLEYILYTFFQLIFGETCWFYEFGWNWKFNELLGVKIGEVRN